MVIALLCPGIWEPQIFTLCSFWTHVEIDANTNTCQNHHQQLRCAVNWRLYKLMKIAWVCTQTLLERNSFPLLSEREEVTSLTWIPSMFSAWNTSRQDLNGWNMCMSRNRIAFLLCSNYTRFYVLGPENVRHLLSFKNAWRRLFMYATQNVCLLWTRVKLIAHRRMKSRSSVMYTAAFKVKESRMFVQCLD